MAKRQLTESQISAKKRLEGYRLVGMKIMKTGHALEQNPFPVLDPIAKKTHELVLNKWYVMPHYMVKNLENVFRPVYEVDEDLTLDHKVMNENALPINVREFTGLASKFCAENNAKLLFSVPKSLVDDQKAIYDPQAQEKADEELKIAEELKEAEDTRIAEEAKELKEAEELKLVGAPE